MIDEVDAISHIQDPVIRNLRITLCYSEISNAVKRLTGGGANWSTFATWASKQAGASIRKEDLKRKIQSAFENDTEIVSTIEEISGLLRAIGRKAERSHVHALFQRFVGRFLPIERTSDATARGNLKVFAEIGREFERFLEACNNASTFDQSRIDEFCQTLRDGEPPDGQRLLKSAFTHYYTAIYESDLTRKQQILFLSNALVGLHEQTRLQPEITEALNVVIDPKELQSEILSELGGLGPLLTKLKLIVRRLLDGPTLLDRAFERLTQRAQRIARAVITEHLLTIGLADGTLLRLSRDLTVSFPASLQSITHAEAVELLRKIDPTPDSTKEAGSADWGDLSDRMHFIVDFFRCYHEDATLFNSPFTAAQLEALKANRLPEGRL